MKGPLRELSVEHVASGAVHMGQLKQLLLHLLAKKSCYHMHLQIATLNALNNMRWIVFLPT